MRGSKTTATNHVKMIVRWLHKQNITNISYGIIIPVKNKRDPIPTVKIKSESGAQLITITGKLYRQDIRIYDNVSKKKLKDMIKNQFNNKLRIL